MLKHVGMTKATRSRENQMILFLIFSPLVRLNRLDLRLLSESLMDAKI
jgi:hypothetical protein